MARVALFVFHIFDHYIEGLHAVPLFFAGYFASDRDVACLVIFYLMYVVCIDHKDFIEWFFIERNAVYGGEVIVLGPDDTLDEPIPISMLKELSYQASFLITQVIYLAALYYPLRGEQHTA